MSNPKDDCGNCRHFSRGYRLGSFKVPSSCNRHFHTVMATDPACEQHERQALQETDR